MRMAYPSAVLDLRDTLAKDCFIEALNDAEMELFVCHKEPETMEDAVRIALKYEAFYKAGASGSCPLKLACACSMGKLLKTCLIATILDIFKQT